MVVGPLLWTKTIIRHRTMPTRQRTPKKQDRKPSPKPIWPVVGWLPTAEVKAFDAMAKTRGLTRSAFVRNLILAALKRPNRGHR